MPIFTDRQYEDFDRRPTLERALGRLPVVMRIDGLRIRWLGPLVDLGHDGWLEELGNGAWGYLEDSGWQELYAEGGEMLNARGNVRRTWAQAFGRAARTLAQWGRDAGPASDPELWASWLAYEMAKPHDYVRARAEARGWDR